MKIKLLFLFLIILMLVSISQPIFAQPNKPNNGDTRIVGEDGYPMRDIVVEEGKPIKLKVRLTEYETFDNKWHGRNFRSLDFEVYKPFADCPYGSIIWSDSAMTGYFSYIASPDEFTLERGNYTLFIVYDGFLKYCDVSVKLIVV